MVKRKNQMENATTQTHGFIKDKCEIDVYSEELLLGIQVKAAMGEKVRRKAVAAMALRDAKSKQRVAASAEKKAKAKEARAAKLIKKAELAQISAKTARAKAEDAKTLANAARDLAMEMCAAIRLAVDKLRAAEKNANDALKLKNKRKTVKAGALRDAVDKDKNHVRKMTGLSRADVGV